MREKGLCSLANLCLSSFRIPAYHPSHRIGCQPAFHTLIALFQPTSTTLTGRRIEVLLEPRANVDVFRKPSSSRVALLSPLGRLFVLLCLPLTSFSIGYYAVFASRLYAQYPSLFFRRERSVSLYDPGRNSLPMTSLYLQPIYNIYDNISSQSHSLKST